MVITRPGQTLALLLFSMAALAPAIAPAADVPSVASCRSISDEKARLACFDKATALPQVAPAAPVAVAPVPQAPPVAPAAPQAVPVQAAPVQAAPLRPLAALRQARAVREPQATQIASARNGPYGELLVTTVEDGTWLLIGARKNSVPPASGGTMTVIPGKLGSFFCELDGRIPVRCDVKD